MNRALIMSRAPWRSLPLLCALLLVPTGCTREPSGTTDKLAAPPSGNVRIIASTVSGKAGGIHRKWTMIGERNWSEAAATATGMSLTKTSALNDPTKKSGCNIWECDLIVEPKPNTPNTLTWKTRIHGIDGTTKESSGDTPSSDGLKAVRILVDKDTLVRLSANLTLAQVGDKAITLSIEK